MLDELSIVVVDGSGNPRRKDKARGDRQMEILLPEPVGSVLLVDWLTNPATPARRSLVETRHSHRLNRR
jgi:hypothetical protein